MGAGQETSIGAHFASLADPRADRGQDHLLLDMITIALCAVICGADGWVAVETFGRAKAAWLRTFLALPGGIPSHDTFGRVFARLDPATKAFAFGFAGWIAAAAAVQILSDDKSAVGRAPRALAYCAILVWVTAAAAGRWIAFA